MAAAALFVCMSVVDIPKPERRATAESMAPEAARDFGQRVLHQEPPPARLRQPRQGAAHHGEGGGRQLARRLRGGRASCPSIARRDRSRSAEERFRVAVEDNGPGIVKAQIPKIFAKLLYGSKFHRSKQSRGQQGIGISAAGLYGQLTTGKPVIIVSKTGKGRPRFASSSASTRKRTSPTSLKDETVEWEQGARHARRDRARRARIAAAHRRGGVPRADRRSPIRTSSSPTAAQGRVACIRARANELPREAQEIKPHPHGVELGMLLNMLQDSRGQDGEGRSSSTISRACPRRSPSRSARPPR